MGGTCRSEESFLLLNLKEKEHLGDLDVTVKTTFKLILMKHIVRTQAVFTCLRTGPGGGLL
jgi:hypothetical protein